MVTMMGVSSNGMFVSHFSSTNPIRRRRRRRLSLKPSASSDESPSDSGQLPKEVPPALKLAMEKARKYKNSKGVGGQDKGLESGAKPGNTSEDSFVQGKVTKKEGGRLTVSTMDFVGLNFSDKKNTRGLPPGLVQVDNTFPQGNMPEVEFIVGDATKFETEMPMPTTPTLPLQDDSDVYKPKVSTWGVFPRPSNISKTFGGGRVIRPGEVLETTEDKVAKQVRTRQLLAAYKTKMGFNIDPKLKSECEKALMEGDYLMETGKLKEALPFYEKVMKELVFQSELHGLAALQWSICQDSLTRSDEARVMYEKLKSHPNAGVNKKARQFLFGFQAIDIMKVKNSSLNTSDYGNYFDAFVEEGKRDYLLRLGEDEQGAFSQTLPYILFLVSPIFLVLCIAALKGT